LPPLPAELRRELEKTIVRAREIAEAGAHAVLRTLGTESESAPAALSAEDRRLRNALRARARVLAMPSDPSGTNALMEEIAYEQWHRMLFARFLAENGLLIHPEGASVSIREVRELARELGEADPWVLAATYAAAMLPGIFRVDDPASQVRLAPDDRLRLEATLTALPSVAFVADDALGWVYQFWQTKAKDEVNRSGRKVGARDLAPVTQLFTEHYMVRFLLENSLGAWWVSRHPKSLLANGWEYLRRRDDGTPAAGTFAAWPPLASAMTVMDPCAGSGHFLVAAAAMLRSMRMEEEGLDAGTAAEAVLRDNIFGLELDPRCTQLAAFALVFDAWKAGLDPRQTVVPNIACSGIGVGGQLAEWKKLAGDDAELRYTLERLYELFRDAAEFGSLIDPTAVSPRDQLFSRRYEDIGPLLEKALRGRGDDPASAVFGAVAEGAERAGKLLARSYTLVTTNPPYLARGKQSDKLKEFAASAHPDGKADLATMFIERCRSFTATGGTYAMVTPQNWLFLSSYKRLRERLLREQTWGQVSRLGARAFDTISGEVVNVALVVLGQQWPAAGALMTGIEASDPKTGAEKARLLREASLALINQAALLRNPDARIVLSNLGSKKGRLVDVAATYEGLHTGDYPRFGRYFWEIPRLAGGWALQQEAAAAPVPWGGRQNILFWEDGKGALMRFVQERLGSEVVTRWIKGNAAWGRVGIAVGAMGDLRPTLYDGALFTHGVYAVIPKSEVHLAALWVYFQSDDFRSAARALDRKVAIARGVFDVLPFDLEYWRRVAAERYPDGLPPSGSDDPTQWVSRGNIVGSQAPLHVAVARLLGYRWPRQEADVLEPLAAGEGILPIPAVMGLTAGIELLRELLVKAYGRDWSASRLDELLAGAGSSGPLELWLRDDFFSQHSRLFNNRPFIWHIWDGRRDGFSALLNYHRLTRQALEKLTYSHLGWWIERQRAGANAKEPGAEPRYLAALELQTCLAKIIEGEPPYDIYVRWKTLDRQLIGWDPDLNDGVRINIRPFVEADVLRSKFTINWNKDRGANPDGSTRINDRHLTREEKLKARARGAAR